jgi:hypothetical protein
VLLVLVFQLALMVLLVQLVLLAHLELLQDFHQAFRLELLKVVSTLNRHPAFQLELALPVQDQVELLLANLDQLAHSLDHQ